LKFGGTTIASHTGAFNALAWRMTADVFVTGASAEEYMGLAIVNGVLPVLAQGTLAIAVTAAVAIDVTGENGTATANDIVCQGLYVEELFTA
jgi:hypothetical protein